jgi:2-succinyl-5-enolpyruvyl-6-hydroxy-3-cyclohexene-1-carboxylate synthase
LNKQIQINRNTLWAEIFIDQLVRLGVQYACISPGSRSTPLALACAGNKNLKSFVHIDERSGGFFALGIARNLKQPVLLVCTSGTAAAEFYPAIIEAYQQNVPLIVCTADRPPELLNCGANQTINQDNLYKNHIKWFVNAGVPEPTTERLHHIRTIARRAVKEAVSLEYGPVHINLPFRKPFEPDIFTDSIDTHLLQTVRNNNTEEISQAKAAIVPDPALIQEITSILIKSNRGLIIVGPGDDGKEFSEHVTAMATLLSYPILADGASQLRYGHHDKKIIFTHYDAYLRMSSFVRKHKPEVIVQFGGIVSSKGLELFLNGQNVFKIHVNREGKWVDPSNYLRSVVQADPGTFCFMVNEELRKMNPLDTQSDWLQDFRNAEAGAASVRQKMIDCTDVLFEGKILRTVFNEIPEGSEVMISNSTPIRDLDYFIPSIDKKIRIHTNRGASGIDGINSTALGIAASSDAPIFLITGDLAFYHDLNGLIAAKKYAISLTVILINNNGGGIFELLPISEYRDIFREYFLTPHDLKFAPFVQAYGGTHRLITSWADLISELRDAPKRSGLHVCEVQTDARASADLRKKYWDRVAEAVSL